MKTIQGRVDGGGILDFSRRDLLRMGGVGLLGASLPGWTGSGGAAAVEGLRPLNRFPRMVHEYYVDRVRRVEREGNRRRAALKTKADAEAYVRDVRKKIRTCFGPMPKKTPLNARIVKTIERDTYKIENVIFESRPGFLVTANLYIPKGRKFPLPGVVGTCGHSSNGKASEFYQSFSQGLARLGYVALIYDPIGQGERLQYPGENLKSKYGAGVREHLHGGNQQFLVGDFFGAWRAWDGIRALDYLLSREEVDPKHVGVTGNSGGGTMTTWLCGVEDRWTMAAPSCFVVTFRRNMENELPADTEQCPPRALELGLDHADFIAAMAPKPVILLSQEKDFFDVRGAEEAFRRLKRLYGLLGAEKNIELFAGPNYHGFSQENREAMYRWFNRASGISKAGTEPEITIEKDETLQCAPEGQVVRLKSRPIYSFTKAKSRALAKKRPKNLSLEELKRRVGETLRLESHAKRSRGKGRGAPPDYRILRNTRNRDFPKKQFTTYAVETERGIQAVVYRLDDERLDARPVRGPSRAILYVPHHSSDAELRGEPLIEELIAAEPDSVLFTCDVRGVGESLPNTTNKGFLEPYGPDYFYAVHAIMLGEPYLGGKTHDVLRVLDWLKANGHKEVHLAARGWGAIPAAFAALLSDGVKQMTLKNALTSYAEVAETEDYQWPLSCLLPDVLKSFDLPDCYRALKAKGLRRIEPWGARVKG